MIEKYKDLFKLNGELAKLVADIWETADFQPETYAQVVIFFFLAKAYKTIQAILLLCRQGYGEDAGILLRSLFEIGVNAWYIADNEELAQRYLDYKAIQVHRLLEDPSWGFILGEVGKDKVREIRERCEEAQAKHKYGKSISWSGKSMKEMAEAVDLGPTYSSIYVIMSQLNHPSAGTMLDYVQMDKEGLVTGVKLSPSDNLIREVLLGTVPLLLNVVKQWRMQFNLGIETKIMEIDSRIMEMEVKYVPTRA